MYVLLLFLLLFLQQSAAIDLGLEIYCIAVITVGGVLEDFSWERI